MDSFVYLVPRMSQHFSSQENCFRLVSTCRHAREDSDFGSPSAYVEDCVHPWVNVGGCQPEYQRGTRLRTQLNGTLFVWRRLKRTRSADPLHGGFEPDSLPHSFRQQPSSKSDHAICVTE